MEEVICKI